MVERYPSNDAILNVVTGKFARLVTERRSLLKNLSTNTEAINQAIGAAHLFGGDLRLPDDMDNLVVMSPSQHTNLVPEPPVQKSLFESAAGEQTIREAVIDHLKNAGERGIRAATIRRAIESMIGRQLHYKTIGMTLYRLSEKGLARREGFTWFYVPQGAAP